MNTCVILLCIKDKKISKYPHMTLLNYYFFAPRNILVILLFIKH